MLLRIIKQGLRRGSVGEACSFRSGDPGTIFEREPFESRSERGKGLR